MSVERELNDITALLSNCLDAFTAALFVWDVHSKMLTLRAHHSLSKHIIPNAQFSPEDGGLVGWVAKKRQPLTVDHFDRDTRILPYYRDDENIKSFLALPLGEGKGVICIDSKRQYVFTNKHQKLLSGFANVIANILGVERTNRRLHLMRRLLTLWHRTDALPADTDDPVPYLTRLLDSACSYLQADAGLVAVPIKEGEFLQLVAVSGDVPETLSKSSLPARQGIIGWIFQHRKSLIIPKFRSKNRNPYLIAPKDGIGKIGALIGMPLAWKTEEVGGVIAFIRRTQANWSREETTAITAVVRRATLVLQNFTLRRELALLRNLDPVTEVCNADAFDRVLNKRLERCRGAGTSLALGIISIGGFEALSTKMALPDLAPLRQRSAGALLKRLKERQLIASLDGGLFAVLFEDETPGDINSQLKVMTTALHREVLEQVDGTSPLPVSFGFALYPRDAAATRELWLKAFQALANKTSSLQQQSSPGK